ncbi:hypothetical protein PVAND_015989 [Polypedilum vanderplanki]|uniref:Uncharacterized protein n=1 Tax=Polypedilum vanderplanki TaxID=319348 RepID=A0A9J6BEK2_POLVA|nr:hypothetical protein PVAND_015989 [Polypedilum vanderplanki]
MKTITIFLLSVILAVSAEIKCPICEIDVTLDSSCICGNNKTHSVEIEEGVIVYCCSDAEIDEKGFWGNIWKGIKNGLKGGSLQVDIPFSGFGKK